MSETQRPPTTLEKIDTSSRWPSHDPREAVRPDDLRQPGGNAFARALAAPPEAPARSPEALAIGWHENTCATCNRQYVLYAVTDKPNVRGVMGRPLGGSCPSCRMQSVIGGLAQRDDLIPRECNPAADLAGLGAVLGHFDDPSRKKLGDKLTAAWSNPAARAALNDASLLRKRADSAGLLGALILEQEAVKAASGAAPPARPIFDLGETRLTSGGAAVVSAMPPAAAIGVLLRHASGDWGRFGQYDPAGADGGQPAPRGPRPKTAVRNALALAGHGPHVVRSLYPDLGVAVVTVRRPGPTMTALSAAGEYLDLGEVNPNPDVYSGAGAVAYDND